MWQAGMYMRVADMLLIIVLMFGTGMFVGNVMFHDMWFALTTALVVGSLPLAFIQFRKKRRLKAFGTQLPFALDLIKSSLEAGHSLQRALQVLVSEFADPLGSEFRTVLELNRIGLLLPRALEDMLKRVPEDDLRLLVVAVRVQTRSRLEPGPDCRTAVRDCANPPALAVADQGADGAIAPGRYDRRLFADCSALCIQPDSAGLHGSIVS